MAANIYRNEKLLLAGVGAYWWGWRLSLGLACAPALVFMLGTVLCPDSPNSILEHDPDNIKKAREVRLPIDSCNVYGRTLHMPDSNVLCMLLFVWSRAQGKPT